jgi:hypothetical protein
MRVAGLLVVAAVCACGGGSGSEGDPDGGNNGGGDGTSSPTATKAGFFTISSSRYTVSTTMIEQGYATGTMYRIPPSTSGGGGCTHASHGACDVQTCDSATTTTDGGLAITYMDSGPIAISGVQVNNGTMTLTPGGYGYVTVSGGVALFNGGSTVRWVAPGNPTGGPGFDVSLVAPTAVQVTAPAFVQGKVSASATQDLSITWSGSTTSAVTAQLAAGVAGHSVVARCTFSSGASGVVPAAAISAVASAGGSASIMVMMENRTTKMPDGWNLDFSLQTYGLVPSGIAVGTLELH